MDPHKVQYDVASSVTKGYMLHVCWRGDEKVILGKKHKMKDESENRTDN